MRHPDSQPWLGLLNAGERASGTIVRVDAQCPLSGPWVTTVLVILPTASSQQSVESHKIV